jgi:predicted amidohydrolase
MRSVRIAAIQPNYIPIPDEYYCQSENYRGNCEEIVSNYVIPQLNVTLNLLNEAGQKGCDIVTTSESITGVGAYIIDAAEESVFPELVRLSQSLVEEELSNISRRYNMYIVGCYFKFIGNKIYNVASIFSREGSIIGCYKKVQLPSDEKFQCVEGESIDIFELDFGKVGIAICYDMMFPEVVQVEALKGAEIIFHPTVGYGWYDSIGEATLRTRANDNSVYIVTAKNYIYNRAGKSSIINYWGEVLVDGGFEENAVIYKDIDLDIGKTQPDWYFPTHSSGVKQVRERMRCERNPELYKIIAEPEKKKYKIPDLSKKQELINNIKSGRCHW